uniref:G_PROTEIN_RECEP_F1_2 domain-containing protein n=1 Tax=Caenorhabditis tropicalis TaxID=1561998 RepID=A0A1I7V2E5_9PELO
MIISGVIGKCANLLMVDAWPVADLIDPLDGYDVYRKLFGKQVTLIATFCYLSEIFINWLMTCHRVSILLSPARAPHWFTDSKMFTYCSGITVFLIIYLLIPYYSPCFVNFNAESSLHETACAPKKHPLTQFQNLYLIWVPVSAVLINSSMIFYIKFARKFFKKPSVLSNATIKRENSMIRQACFIATYLSIFEIGYLFMRLFPAEFGSLPQEIQSVTYQIRLFANCSLNFFVYFVETKSTRTLVLNYVGFRKKSLWSPQLQYLQIKLRNSEELNH